jgi:hypothetical protein
MHQVDLFPITMLFCHINSKSNKMNCFCWFLYTFNIHLYMHIFHRIFLSNYWWQESDIWSQTSYTYMKLVTKYQISGINSCWEKCDEKWAYMFNVYKNQLSRQTGSRYLMGSNYWCQISDIWSQASYRYPISWEAFLNPSDSCFLFGDLVGFYTHWTYMHIFCHIFLSNYWWQKNVHTCICSMCIKTN